MPGLVHAVVPVELSFAQSVLPAGFLLMQTGVCVGVLVGVPVGVPVGVDVGVPVAV